MAPDLTETDLGQKGPGNHMQTGPSESESDDKACGRKCEVRG